MGFGQILLVFAAFIRKTSSALAAAETTPVASRVTPRTPTTRLPHGS